MKRLNRPRVPAAAFLALCTVAPAFAAAPAEDRILFGQTNGSLVIAPLPNGPAGPPTSTPIGITSLLALPSGQILAASFPPVTGHGLHRSTLNELLPNGTLRAIGFLELPPIPPYSGPGATADLVKDMALDHRGNVYAMIYTASPIFQQMRLDRLDPVTGARLGSVLVDAATNAIATAPTGLWAVTGSQELRRLDPDTGAMSEPLLSIATGNVAEIETDSAGLLWYLSQWQCESGLCQVLGTVDIATGVQQPAPEPLQEQTPAAETFTIDRACSDSATVRCLQGGRFRAEIAYRAYDGAAGPAQAAPARSADTAIFSFFDPDNWELMVKVLDGCHINQHFWVYASASTDVEYTMTITDTETGAEKIYRNTLGQVALTVTDNLAFACAP